MTFVIRTIALCIMFYFSPIVTGPVVTGPVITTTPLFMSGGIIQIGDAVALYCLAKILSLKYKIPFCYSHFRYHDFFAFSDTEKSDLTESIWTSGRERISIRSEDDIVKNLHKHAVLYTGLKTRIDYVAPEWYEEVKKDLRLKHVPAISPLPKDRITIGLHIRKGNGGGQLYDGEVVSLQEFDFDRNRVHYDTNFDNFPFDWQTYLRKNGYFVKDYGYKGHPALDTVIYIATKFPPNQYYIDTLIKLSNELNDRPLFVQIFTDDKAPEALVERIGKAVNRPNILFHYENDRHLPYPDRILRDLYALSQFDVLVRPQSYFSRIAEMIGKHKVVIYPLHYEWEGKKLLMTHVVIKGSIKKLLAE